MIRVGLTGGIGAGKSTVATRLASHGAVVIDADRIAREVVEPGQPALADIVEQFGPHVLTGDGALDRAALANVAFADEESRKRLNAIMHPRIGQATAEAMAQAPEDAIIVHDVPLLVETGLAPSYHLVIVVDAPEAERVRRLVSARGMSADDAQARIAAQATTDQRRAAADVWLCNDGDVGALERAVDAVWRDRLVPLEENIRLRRAAALPAVSAADPVLMRRLCERIKAAVGALDASADVVESDGMVTNSIAVTVSTVDSLAAVSEALAAAGFPPAPGENHVFGNADAECPVTVVVATPGQDGNGSRRAGS